MAAFAPPTSPAVSAAHGRAASSPPPQSPTSPVRRPRAGSLTQSFLDANPHYGFCAATGDAIASAPSLRDLRRNSLGSNNSGSRSRSRSGTQRRGSSISAASPGVDNGGLGAAFPIHEEADPREAVRQPAVVDSLVTAGEKADAAERQAAERQAADDGHDHDGEHRPHWWAVTKSGLYAFWKWFLTPMGFLITIYMLNVVAWGGMLFLLLCNAAPAMCVPDCGNIDSPRRVWIEIDSQILNALFCVTGFGLIPWRFRDLYFLLRWRARGDKAALRRLATIHQGWFRVPEAQRGVEGGEVERGRLTEGEEAGAAGTETGLRAPPTKSWKIDFVIWLYVWNTFLQAVLSGFMWGMNRIERPSWSTGLFVALAFIAAGVAGGVVWWEGRKVKRIEGEHKDGQDEEKKSASLEENKTEEKRSVEAGSVEGNTI